MFGVEEHEIAAGVLQQMADAGGDELDDEMADLDGALARHCFQPVAGIVPPCPMARDHRAATCIPVSAGTLQ